MPGRQQDEQQASEQPAPPQASEADVSAPPQALQADVSAPPQTSQADVSAPPQASQADVSTPSQASQADASVTDYFIQQTAVNDFNGQDASLRTRDRDRQMELPVQGSLNNGHYSYELLPPQIHSSINANGNPPVHRVDIEYLRNDQFLIIPTPLGMSPLANVEGRAQTDAQLSARYWRATQFTYAEIRDMILPSHNQLEVCQAVDAIAYQVGNEIFNDWNLTTWYDGFEMDQPELKDVVMAAFSLSCEFNCDVRDVGVLNRPDMLLDDTAWAMIENVPLERLENKLRKYSIQCIAALNYEPVGRYALAAYVRAFGLCIGILPSKTSAMQIEWTFSLAQPSDDSVMAVKRFREAYQCPLKTLCANILAMFGILHLAKGSTYKSNDFNMDRICASYINTLRTIVNTYADIDDMLSHKEAITRTGPHPFGLAQTLWIARVMGKHGLLAAPLALRLNATPPPVQRLMLADVCVREWTNFPASVMVLTLSEGRYDAMREEIKRISINPPAYSSLHRFYGIQEQQFIRHEVATYIEEMMPFLYGYIMVVHQNEMGYRDGLGLALCLENIAREKRDLANMWIRAWQGFPWL